VIFALVAAWFFLHQTNTNKPQTNTTFPFTNTTIPQTNTSTPRTYETAHSKITTITADMSWNNPVGVTIALIFNVTVQNIGTNDIGGANITVERITNENDSQICEYYCWGMKSSGFSTQGQ
jgi:hypothetical protein